MLIDLSHPLQTGMPVYPGDRPPDFRPRTTLERHGYAVIDLQMSTHTGTHIDAPCHMVPGTRSLDAFGVDKFVGPGVVLDVRGRKAIELDFLQLHIAAIEAVDFVLFYAGWQEKWGTEAYFHPFPSLTSEAAEWMGNQSLKAIGFDLISVDAIDAEVFVNHHILLGKDILVVENLTNLDRLLGKAFEFSCLPLHLKNADGSPVRAVARIL